jgi:hypothetical protein
MQKSSVEVYVMPGEHRVFKYDFALSFAGEQREIAEQLARLLQSESVRVFYDKDAQADLWGQDLYQTFQ